MSSEQLEEMYEIFSQGHFNVEIGKQHDDYDVSLTDYYFYEQQGLKGEVTDTNGSECLHIEADGKNVVVVFWLYDREFETQDGETVSFEQKCFKCSGTIEYSNNQNEFDDYYFLKVEDFKELTENNEYDDFVPVEL